MKRLRRCFYVLLVLTSLYGLAMGPESILVQKGRLSDEAWLKFNAPWVWLTEHVPVVGSLIDYYLGFWVVSDGGTSVDETQDKESDSSITNIPATTEESPEAFDPERNSD